MVIIRRLSSSLPPVWALAWFLFPYPIPNIKSIFLFLPFNRSFRSSPQSIHHFLCVHSTNIRHLQLRLMETSWQWENSDDSLGTWLSDFVNDMPNNGSTMRPSLFFPNLRTLDFHPPATTTGLSATLAFIKRTVPTLSSLIIREEKRRS